MQAVKMRPLEKRHTKPCKFYQTMSCPLPADVCDFAHVLVNPTPAFRVHDFYRPHQPGYCENGTWCRYGRSDEDGMGMPGPSGQRMRSLSTGGVRPFIPQTAVRRRSSVISMHGPTGAGPCSHSTRHLPTIPTKVPIAPLTSPPSVKHRSFPNTLLPPPGAYPEIVDELMVCTKDPQINEHPHSYQSRVYITEATPPVHVPPYPTSLPHTDMSIGPLSPHYQIPSPVYVLEPQFFPVQLSQAPPKKRRSRGISKKKLERYKTKPCKFFTTNGVCPNGDSCTFIHDEDPRTLRRNYFKDSSEHDEHASESSEFSSMPSSADDQAAREIAVRVGAMALNTEDQIFLDTGPAGPSKSYTHLVLPIMAEEEEEEKRAVTANGADAKKMTRRPRANSIPSTPSVSGQGAEILFSAESPAIL